MGRQRFTFQKPCHQWSLRPSPSSNCLLVSSASPSKRMTCYRHRVVDPSVRLIHESLDRICQSSVLWYKKTLDSLLMVHPPSTFEAVDPLSCLSIDSSFGPSVDRSIRTTESTMCLIGERCTDLRD